MNILDEKMPYGKFRGQPIKKVAYEFSYLQWFLPKCNNYSLRNKLLCLYNITLGALMNGYVTVPEHYYQDIDKIYNLKYKDLKNIAISINNLGEITIL